MNDIGIKPLTGAVTTQPGKGVSGAGESGFGDMLKNSIDSVNQKMQEAETSVAGLVSGQHSNIHETMIAMEKANISFRLMTKIQNKVVNAYQEIMRLQL
ncbi:MAG: flagellar hook-basal body complex protein FliE [Proteobacteria bacterium]|nr:flagellar hook-basal body complex protein FliE [Pseudomonadota bacterium]MBU1710540.1 flagellar hook-basal body complex protein FliE [Pseudomonadota bacterium]